MTAPDRIVVLWSFADEDTMPATVAAHTEKSRDFGSGAPRWMHGERVEYIRADLVDPAAIREAAIRECAAALRKVIDYAAFAGADPDEVEDAAINSYADFLLALIHKEPTNV